MNQEFEFIFVSYPLWIIPYVFENPK